MKKTELVLAEEMVDVIKNYLIMSSETYKKNIHLYLAVSQNFEETLVTESERKIFAELDKLYEKNLNRELLRTVSFIIKGEEKDMSLNDMYVFCDKKIKKLSACLCQHLSLLQKYEQCNVIIGSFYFNNAEEYIKTFFGNISKYCT